MNTSQLRSMGLIRTRTIDARRRDARAAIVRSVADALNITPADFNRRLASGRKGAFDSLPRRVYGPPEPMPPVFDPIAADKAAYDGVRCRLQGLPKSSTTGSGVASSPTIDSAVATDPTAQLAAACAAVRARFAPKPNKRW
jgi:hypothetical protein